MRGAAGQADGDQGPRPGGAVRPLPRGRGPEARRVAGLGPHPGALPPQGKCKCTRTLCVFFHLVCSALNSSISVVFLFAASLVPGAGWLRFKVAHPLLSPQPPAASSSLQQPPGPGADVERCIAGNGAVIDIDETQQTGYYLICLQSEWWTGPQRHY